MIGHDDQVFLELSGEKKKKKTTSVFAIVVRVLLEQFKTC